MSDQPDALRLAQALNNRQECEDEAAAELRRLYAENESLRQIVNDFPPVEAELREVSDRAHRLEAQRDALLEALIRCRNRFFPSDQPERDRDELWEPVNAAIKAVEEEA